MEEQVASFEGVRGKLAPDVDLETFLDVVRTRRRRHRYSTECMRLRDFAADTQDQKRAKSDGARSSNLWQRSRIARCSSTCGGRIWTM